MQKYKKTINWTIFADMNTFIRILFMAFAMVLCSSSPAQEMFVPAHPAPKREVRGVWITTLGGLDWPKTKASSTQGMELQKQELKANHSYSAVL